MVYEAGFVVASGAAQRQDLAELQLVMCNEADAHDEDFCGLAKASDCMIACLHVPPAAFGSSGSNCGTAAQHVHLPHTVSNLPCMHCVPASCFVLCCLLRFAACSSASWALTAA